MSQTMLRLWLDVLHEARKMQFFHGSRREFPVGFVLTPQIDGYVHGVAGDEFDAAIRRREKILEMHRPAHLISRLHCVYLTNSIRAVEYAGGNVSNIYQVEPIGPVEESCLWWYQQLEHLDDMPKAPRRVPTKVGEQLAYNYWHNVPPPEGQPATYEFRCRQARIIKRR